MKVEFITKEDLEIFKQEIIIEIRRYSPFNRKKDQEIKQWIKKASWYFSWYLTKYENKWYHTI